MKVLFTCIPGYGHLYPMIPLAQALTRAGHAVRFLTSASFVPAVEATGYDAEAAGIDWTESDPERAFPEFLNVDAAIRTELLTQVFSYHHPRGMVPRVRSAIREWRPDLVVHDRLEHGGQLAAELEGVPWVLVDFMLIGGEFSALLPRELKELKHLRRLRNGKHSLRALRTQVGLPPEPPPWKGPPSNQKYLTLDLLPPSLHIFTARAASATAHLMRPVPYNYVSAASFRVSPAAKSGPVAHVTLGTVFHNPAAIKTILEGLKQCRVTVIFSEGKPSDLPAPAVANGVVMAPWIPHNLLLPECDVLISHGGWGTIIAGLMHELPLIIIPQGAEQARNAAMIQAVGAGRFLQDLTGAAVAHETRKVLDNEIYRENVKRLKAEILEMPGPDEAVSLLERLAVERAPLLVEDRFRYRVRPSLTKTIRVRSR